MTGLWAGAYPDLAHGLASNPQFEIGNHTYAHAAYHVPCYRLAGLSREGLDADISASQVTIERIAGVRPTYFRFPGGCYDRAALDAVHAGGLIPVQWTVNAGDPFNPYPQQIASTVLQGIKPGTIVIMHLHPGPNAPSSGAALRIILPALRAQGYEFVKVGELLAQALAVEPATPPEVVEFYQPEPPPVLRRADLCGGAAG